MNQYPGHDVSKRFGCARCLRRLAWRLIGISAGVWIGCGAGAAPTQGLPDHSPASLIQAGLADASITSVSVEKFAEAVKQAVIASPTQAAAILTAALSVKRKDSALIAGRLVGAAIEGLGPKAGEAAVTALVRIGVELQPSAVLFIVRAAARVSRESLASAIVNAAVVTLKNPSNQIIERINAVAANAKSGGDNDVAGLALEPALEAVGELNQAPMLTGEPSTIPPLSPRVTSTPTPTRIRNSTQIRTPTPPPSPSL